MDEHFNVKFSVEFDWSIEGNTLKSLDFIVFLSQVVRVF